MKALLILTFLVSANWVYAADVPTGNFDCSQTRGSFTISITSQTPLTFVEVRHVLDQEETTLQGPALISKNKRSNGSTLNRIYLLGSNVELFFDDQGHLGLEPGTLNCRKI